MDVGEPLGASLSQISIYVVFQLVLNSFLMSARVAMFGMPRALPIIYSVMWKSRRVSRRGIKSRAGCQPPDTKILMLVHVRMYHSIFGE